MTFPEVLVWRALRKRAQGLRFRRQHPCGPYVLDFYSDEARLAVEIDGSVHQDAGVAAYDASRDVWLGEQGIHVLRLPARLILADMDAALQMIVRVAEERKSELPA